jgi:hypothetical protein
MIAEYKLKRNIKWRTVATFIDINYLTNKNFLTSNYGPLSPKVMMAEA